MANQNKLKAWVRYDGTGRVVTGGPILQANKPKVGNWRQMNASLCCNGSTPSTTTSTTTQGGPTQWSFLVYPNSADACFGNTGFGFYTVYTASSTLGVGVTMWANPELTIPYSDYPGRPWLAQSSATFSYYVQNGVILSVENCSTLTTTTTQPPVQLYRLGPTGYPTSEQACTNGAGDLMGGSDVYSAGPAYEVPTQLYTDAGLTIPLALGTTGRYPIMQSWPSGTLRSAYVDTSGMMYNALPC